MTKRKLPYEDLEKYFTEPKRKEGQSGFYPDDVKIPRKLKKKVKKAIGPVWDYDFLTKGQKLWYYMWFSNPNYVRFLIKQVCKR